MKKIILMLALLLAFVAAQAQHIEFKWHGFYGVAGYAWSTNLNKSAGSNDADFADTVTFNSFYAVAGWQIRKGSGLGLGVEFMKDATGAFTQLPVFVEVRSHFLRNRVTPFTVVQVGYSIPLGSASSGKNSIQITGGGLTWNLQVGARFAATPKFAINAFVGYQGFHMNHVERKVDGAIYGNRPKLLHDLKVGVAFNF